MQTLGRTCQVWSNTRGIITLIITNTKHISSSICRCQGSLEIRKENDQWGVYAIRAFEKGEVVISSDLKDDNTKPTDKPCAHSIQIGWNKHILMNLPARYLNHSCDPNIAVVGLNEKGSYDFEALRDIGSDKVCSWTALGPVQSISAYSLTRIICKLVIGANI